MKIALASVSETRDILIDAYDKKYITEDEMNAGLKLGAPSNRRSDKVSSASPNDTDPATERF
jgi:hypothetical protein